jgi:hypothetical protein
MQRLAAATVTVVRAFRQLHRRFKSVDPATL